MAEWNASRGLKLRSCSVIDISKIVIFKGRSWRYLPAVLQLQLLVATATAQLVHIGSGPAVTGVSEGSPINASIHGRRCQFVCTRAELRQAGAFGPAVLEGMGFFIYSAPSTPLKNYTIRLKHTTAINSALADTQGLKTYLQLAAYSPSAGGFEVLTLDSGFYWNGADNILIDICWQPFGVMSSNGGGQVRYFEQANGFRYSENPTAGDACILIPNLISNRKPQLQMRFLIPNSNMVLDSVLAFTPTQAPVRVRVGTVQAEILGVRWDTYGSANPLIVNGLQFACTGTTTSADILKVRLYSSGSTPFFNSSTAVLLAETMNPGCVFNFLISHTLVHGPNYFWLTYDIAPTAAAGNLLDAVLTLVSLNTGARLPEITNPVGSRQIYDPFVGLPFRTDFEAVWQNLDAIRDVPGPEWDSHPAVGNSAWRSNDDIISGEWTSAGGAYVPGSSGGRGNYSARFHSSDAAVNATGILDLALDFSAPGTKALTLDYINADGSDRLEIRLSTDNGRSFSPPIATLYTTQGWQQFDNIILGASLSSYCILRFVAVADSGNSDIGIDNVQVRVLPPHDIGILKLLAPKNGCGLANEPVRVLIKNYGTLPVSNFVVGYQLAGQAAVREPVNSLVVRANDTVSYQFKTLLNLSAVRQHQLTIFTELTSDGDTSNDKLVNQTVEHLPIITGYPYLQTFESGAQGWSAMGASSTWALGLPQKNTIRSAASGTNAFVTGGLGKAGYAPREQSYVISPCFNFSNLRNPVVLMKVFWNSTFSAGAALQYTIDGGVSWKTVGRLDRDWYNATMISGMPGGQRLGWSGSDISDWQKVRVRLDSLGGYPEVRFRVVFGAGSDAAAGDGFAFDDFEVRSGPLPSLGPDRVLCPGGELKLEAGTFRTYLWTTGDTTQQITIRKTGSYVIKVTDSDGFEGFDTIFIHAPAAVPDLGPDRAVCYLHTEKLSAEIPGARSYRWGHSTTTDAITFVTAPGNYWVEVIDSNGCVLRDSVRLSLHSYVPIYLSPDTGLCPGSGVRLDPGPGLPGSVFRWNTGAQSQAIWVSAPGEYIVTVTAPDGCQQTDTIIVKFAFPPAVNLGPDIKQCKGLAVKLDAFVPNCTYVWSTGDTTAAITVNNAGIYWVEVSNAFGCSSRDTIAIGISDPDVLFLGRDTMGCRGVNITVTGRAVGIRWSSGDTARQIRVYQSGDYVAEGYDEQGCVALDTVRVTILSAPEALIAGPDTGFVYRPVQLIDGSFPIPTAWEWDFGDGSPLSTDQFPTHSYTTAGNYTVRLTAWQNQCADTTTHIITIIDRTGAEKPAWARQLSVYPSPVINSNYFFIKDFDPGQIQLKLVDLSGRAVDFRIADGGNNRWRLEPVLPEEFSGMLVLQFLHQSQVYSVRVCILN